MTPGPVWRKSSHSSMNGNCVEVAAVEAPGVDGAVAELHVQPDGRITAEIRIPARQD